MYRRQRHDVGEVVLRVDGVTNEHVHDITFSVRGGEVVALAGLVGAGRTELARTIVGDLPMSSGTVTMNGGSVRLRSPADAIEAGIGLAPEERKAQALLMERTVRDNIVLAVLPQINRLGFVSHATEDSLAADFVKRLGIRTPTTSQLVKNLSGGNQQKVVLARWLARRPALLILDEPTRGVDVGAKSDIYAIISELAASGTAVLLISSELPEVLGLADRIIVMQAGRISGELGREGATEEKILSLAMKDELTMMEDDE